ncbi:MAG: cell division protein ZapA [Bacteroidales bacterium]|jgi:cell division protein ZapA (FtsZ GTPase activity inhibitor)|nr:cell division protein ZapA [Bacteroidales bacterium]NLM93011.1 cell division protein ZapA [Bacteroidales bacterium]
MKEQLISVIIAERPYRLSVKSEEEEQVFREAAKLIRDKMTDYGSAYAFRDKQDLLAMVTLQFAVESLGVKQVAGSQIVLKDKLQKLERILDEHLNES